MFYSQSLLSRKGPLGNIWMAAYCFKRLKREQIAGTDITSSIDKIMPEVHFSYRVLAQLLLGIVKIFSKKVDYLYYDCNDTLTILRKSFVPISRTVSKESTKKRQDAVRVVKQVMRPLNQKGTVSKNSMLAIPMEEMRAPYHRVTIVVPERFELDAFELEGADEGERDKKNDKPREQSLFQDEQTEETNEASFFNESYHVENVSHAEFSPLCFTPVQDVLPSDMMDIDLHIRESSSTAKKQDSERDVWHLEEFDNPEIPGGSMLLGSNLHDKEPEDQVHLLNLQETVPVSIDQGKNIEEPKVQAMSHMDYERSHLTTGGLATPKLMATTPAKRERTPKSRKRKNLFDESVVLSNDTLRKGLHDASSLVCKRRRLPLTVLDAWKASRITNLQKIFMDPLIPFVASKLEALFHLKFSGHLSPRETRDSLSEEVNVQGDDIPNKVSDVEHSIHEGTSRDSPPPEKHSASPTASELIERDSPPPEKHSASATASELIERDSPPPEKHYASPTASELIEAEVRASPSIDILDVLNLIDLEITPNEISNGQDDVWAKRDRAVAQCLHSRLNVKKGEQNGTMNLNKNLEGKTRTTCARFFYQTLVLKSRGLVDIKQGCPYGDIILSATSRLEAMFTNQ